MPRFIVLEHTGAPDDPAGRHWDLLLEDGPACRTWRLAALPAPGGPAVAAVELPPHRLAWLDHEAGDVSGGRGFARRIDAGTCEPAAPPGTNRASDVDVTLLGDRLRGRLVLRRHDDHYMARLLERASGGVGRGDPDPRTPRVSCRLPGARPMTPREVLAFCREKEVKAVDLRFADFLGAWQHFTIPVSKLEEATFEDGLGFDGSSIRGWQAINESDMLLVPVPDTAFVDPFARIPTLVMICMIQDPITREDYSRDPRNIARKATTYLAGTGIADTCHVGPEAEFFVFDDVRFDQNAHEAFYHVDSAEAEWNRGRAEGPNLGYKLRHQQGYFPCPPSDQLLDLRTEMVQAMIHCGIDVEAQHHERATAGQCEIDVRYQELVRMADQMCLYKYIVRNVARRHGRTATFMPKPILGDAGSGMHTHFSLWKGGQPLFAGTGYAGLSDTALFALGGILRHAPAILAITNPTTNSYKRLVPGYEAPINLAYSQRNRSAACRIPMYSANPASKRIEFRCPDPACNPYLAFAAILMAAIDGIQNRIHPGPPLDRDIYDLPPEELADVPRVPGSLAEAVGALERDHDFLLRGDVFTEDVIATWIAWKRDQEITPLRLRPHPYEFCLYFDA